MSKYIGFPKRMSIFDGFASREPFLWAFAAPTIPVGTTGAPER